MNTNKVLYGSNEQSDRILRISEVAHRTGLSTSQLYRLVAAGEFPRPFLIVRGGRAKGWMNSCISEWLKGRVQHEENPA
jgi:prophage regulatory protein